MSRDQASRRWAVCGCLAAVVLAAGSGERAGAAGPLEALLKDYQAYELPLPPAGAELAVVAGRSVSFRDGAREQGRHLVFLIKKATPGDRAVYWAGCDAVRAWRNAEFRPVPPQTASLKDTAPLPPECWRENAFPTCPDLALAVQCYAKGWKDLAEALLERSRQRQENDHFRRRKQRPADDRAALAELAWNHFCNEFAVSRGDRRPIVARMKKLLAAGFGLDDKPHRNLIADMDRTLAKSEAAAGSVEAAIDALVDLDVEGSWPGCGYEHFNNYAHWNAHYRRLRDGGCRPCPSSCVAWMTIG
jgi:hypothetical protein